METIKDMIDYPCQLKLIEAREEIEEDLPSIGLSSYRVCNCQARCALTGVGLRFKYLAGAETLHDKVANIVSIICSDCEYRKGLEDVKHGRRECE